MSSKVYDIITGQILEKIKEGVIPWRHPWTAGVPKNAVSGNQYNGFNVFRLGFEEYKNPNWATFKQVGDLGGRVARGEKSTAVIFWKLNKYIEKKTDEEKIVPMLRYYRIFNIEQTDLTDDERFVVAKNDNPPIQACENIMSGYKTCPKIVNDQDARAYFDFQKDIINMPKQELFDSSEDYYSVLFHESTHSTGHHSRLVRRERGEYYTKKNPEYWFEEIIAELGAAYLGGHAGIGYHTLNNSASYIEGYYTALKNDNSLFIRAASAAQKAAEYIRTGAIA